MEIESYVVQENESLFSVSLKFDMPVYNLKRLNQLSEDSIIYPGMVLKVKKGIKTIPEEEDRPQMNLNKAEVYYCCKSGDIRGILSYNDDLLIFTPDCISHTYCLVKDTLGIQQVDSLEYHQCLDLKDVLSVSLVEYPGFDAENLQQDQLYLKIIVSKTSPEAKETNKLTPKGTMYFRVRTI
jgi:LysM repeat protein